MKERGVGIDVVASPMGREFQAMVSVMAVKIQFNSPSGVRRSFNFPGTLQGGDDGVREG